MVIRNGTPLYGVHIQNSAPIPTSIRTKKSTQVGAMETALI